MKLEAPIFCLVFLKMDLHLSIATIHCTFESGTKQQICCSLLSEFQRITHWRIGICVQCCPQMNIPQRKYISHYATIVTTTLPTSIKLKGQLPTHSNSKKKASKPCKWLIQTHEEFKFPCEPEQSSLTNAATCRNMGIISSWLQYWSLHHRLQFAP